MRRMMKAKLLRPAFCVSGSTLLETVVASVLFLAAFMSVMELLPRIAAGDNDAMLHIEAEYRAGEAFDKYASGLWPCGEYVERYEWGDVTVRIGSYREYADLCTITVEVRMRGGFDAVCRRQIIKREL